MSEVYKYDGQERPIEEWAAEVGISPDAIRDRLAAGESIAEVLQWPIVPDNFPVEGIYVPMPNGELLEVHHASLETGIPEGVLYRRILGGWPLADVATVPYVEPHSTEQEP